MPKPLNEAWIYNVLQHTEDPAIVCAKAREWGRIVRVFEWLNVPACDGHLHVLSRQGMDDWLGGCGATEEIHDKARNLHGTAYYGIFKGNYYADQ